MKKVYIVVQVEEFASTERPVVTLQRQRDGSSAWDCIYASGVVTVSFGTEQEAMDYARQKAGSHPGSRYDVLVSARAYLTAYPVTEVKDFGA